MKLFSTFLICVTLASGQPEAEVFRIGGDVKPPTLLKKVDPSYSPDARDARIQGTVLLELIVDPQGRPSEIKVLSPLGYGLDERALRAVEQWKFGPATKASKPVASYATIEVSFRFQGLSFDSKWEARRTEYNVAVQALQGNGKTKREKALESIQKLAQQKFPAALYYYGRLLETGDGFPADPAQAQTLVMEAAKANYGPALYSLGRLQLDGKGVPQDAEKGKQNIHRAAVLGSQEAQYFLAASYEMGSGYEQSEESARQYFRMCAATGQGLCQFRLGRLLLARPKRREFDYVQALAWLELAEAQGDSEATALLNRERSNLSPQQLNQVATLREQLVHK